MEPNPEQWFMKEETVEAENTVEMGKMRTRFGVAPK
jgi:hypothetical protein